MADSSKRTPALTSPQSRFPSEYDVEVSIHFLEPNGGKSSESPKRSVRSVATIPALLLLGAASFFVSWRATGGEHWLDNATLGEVMDHVLVERLRR